jgi:hypothetical protein
MEQITQEEARLRGEATSATVLQLRRRRPQKARTRPLRRA